MSFRALKLGIYAISTIDRLCELKERLGPIGVLSSDLGQAVEFLMSARIGHQFELRENG
jgi:signal-transduction protein with cAMP-binding, CBS, and nucleotidyltransferase domain